MLNINDSLQALRELGMNEDEIQKFKSFFEPQINFHKYLMEKLSISSEDTENLTKEYSRLYIDSSLKKLQDDGEDLEKYDTVFYFSLAGQSFKKLAIEHGYEEDKASELETSIVNMAITSLAMQKRIEELENNLKK